MRILTVSHFFESHGGGIERVAGHLCRQFARLGETAVWAASNSEAPPTGEIEAAPLECANPTEKWTGLPMPLPGLRAIQTVAREVRRSDAVVIHDALYATSIVAMLIAKSRRKRTILVQHIGGIPFSSPLLRTLMRVANRVVTRPMLRAADECVFISQAVRLDLLAAVRSSELLFNGVDHAIFHPAHQPRAEGSPVAGARAWAGPRVLFVGRYVEKKGLRVLCALAALRPDLGFFMVGSGPIDPAAWGLPNVHDLGPQSQEVVADLYRWADLLLLPSVGEGYPLVIQEAMACGLPVVCGEPSNHADPGAERWLRGVGIDLADPHASAERCSEAIDSLALTDADREEMAIYARRHYDWEAMARRLLVLVQSRRTTELA